MKIAVIDCGTNIFNLLIGDRSTGEILHAGKELVNLGEGGMDGPLSSGAFERGMRALKLHHERLLHHQVDAVYALATSGLRSASNGREFAEAARQRFGIVIHIISGEDEADLIYRGVRQGVDFTERPTAIIDIGGGSTELISLRKMEPVAKFSLLLGSSRLLEEIRPADPIRSEQCEEVYQLLEERMAGFLAHCAADLPRVLIGSSGSFDTLAQMCVANFSSSFNKPEETSYTFDLYQYRQIAQRMIESNYEERWQTPGMDPMRVDNIVMACLQINFLIDRLGIKTLQQCNFALKEGVFDAIAENPDQWQKSSL